MQMTVTVNEHGTYTLVGFINNYYLLVCVRTACARLINTYFLVLRHVLIFIRRTKHRALYTHS